MRKPFIALFLSIIIIAFFLVSMAKGESSDINESLKVYNECIHIKNSSNSKKIVYVRDYETYDFGEWQIFDKNKDRYWNSEIDLIFNNDILRVISYFETDPGGDTAQYLDYYFRNDGTVACIVEDSRILAGYDTKTITKVYLNRKGEVIDHNITVYDLHTEKIKNDKEDISDEFPEIFRSTKGILIKYKVPFK
ncbi:MAG: hypothetical protein ACM3YE_13455 [Bacteroidota bacterium]